MGDPSKSLTVTFGTFTCTVTGYEDPFPILRQTVQYLQSVTEDDPAFGTRNYGNVSAASNSFEDDAPIGTAAPVATPASDVSAAFVAETANDDELLSHDDVWTDLDNVDTLDDPADDQADGTADEVDAVDEVIEETVLEVGEPEIAAQDTTDAAPEVEIDVEEVEETGEDSLRPEWVGVSSSDDDPLEPIETATGVTPEEVAEPIEENPEARSVHLSFGSAPGLDQAREAKLADVPPPPPEEAFAPANGQPIFEEEEDLATFDFPSGEGFGETAEKFNGENKGEPLVLTTEMAVEFTDDTDRTTPEETTTETETAQASDPPVLRLVEAVESADRDNGSDDNEVRALKAFADRAGASTLPDLLEASAAYVTLIDGRDSFSRGEILRMLDSISEGGGFSQEARIKSFGALLRGGRIHRVENGEFEMSRKARANYEEAAATAM